MSLIGTLTKFGAQAAGVSGVLGTVSSLFGGGGSNVNLARSFSRSCGFPQPVTDAVKQQAQAMGGDVCANAWRIANGGFTPLYSSPVPAASPIPMFNTGDVLAAVTGSGSAAAMSALPGVGAAAAGFVRRLSPSLKRKAIAFAKNFGIQLAATVFGLSLLEMAEIVAKPPRRRRRGITAAQLANARRVNCKVASMARSLGVTSRAPARRSTCRSKPSCR